MGGIESLLIGNDDDDVAIQDGLAKEAVVGYLCLGNIAITLAVDAILQCLDSLQAYSIAIEHLVTALMRGHPIHVDMLHRRERWIYLNVSHNTLLHIVIDPSGKIMLALLVSHVTTDISHVLQLLTIVSESIFLALGASRQRHHHLNVCRAIQLGGIDDQSLIFRRIQGACHIRHAQEFLAKIEHPNLWLRF